MSAILAKKLGMTQVFLEDGRVERVTVLEAGPCPVTAKRTADRDGYDAVQLAFGATKEKHLSKPELGHLKKAVALKPDYAEAWYAMKTTYEGLKKFESSVEALNKALALNPRLSA